MKITIISFIDSTFTLKFIHLPIYSALIVEIGGIIELSFNNSRESGFKAIFT